MSACGTQKTINLEWKVVGLLGEADALARRRNRRRSEHQTMRLRHQATHNNGKDEDAAAIPTLFQRQRLRRLRPRRAVRCRTFRMYLSTSLAVLPPS